MEVINFLIQSLSTSRMSDLQESSSSSSSGTTPPSSVSSPKPHLSEVAEQDKQIAAKLKAEANKAFSC